VPQRGEWIDVWAAELDEPAHPPLSELPIARRVDWSEECRERWGVWCRDPVAAYWTTGDVLLAVDTLAIFRDAEESGKLPLTEISRRLDRLALSPAGKRNLRFRIRFAPWEEPGLEPRPEEPEPEAPNVTPIGSRRGSLSA
jgi:hypothetical protein